MNSPSTPIKSLAALLEKAANSTAEGITISSMSLPDRPLIYLNEGFERLTGYSRKEALGKNCRFLQGTDTAPQAVKEIRKAIQEGKSCTVELLNYHKNGNPFWNRLSITPLTDDQNKITHYVGIQSDITELKQTKQALESANSELLEFQLKIQNELEQARKAQLFLLPTTLPNKPNLKFASKFVPMAQVGGDFFDVIELNDGKFGIMVADVTGHGIPAALITFMSSTTFKDVVLDNLSPSSVISTTNKRLYGKIPNDAFLTMFYAVYDANKKQLSFTQAGHPPAVLLRNKSKEIIVLTTKDPLVGILSADEAVYTETSIDLMVGDRLLLFTDAILEVINTNSEMLGMDGFLSWLENQWEKTLEELLEEIYLLGLEFSNAPAYQDDFTFVAMEVE